MRIAQFKDSTGYIVGLRQKDKWLNLSLGIKMYSELAEGRDRPLIGKIKDLFAEDGFEIAWLKRVGMFIKRHDLSSMLRIGKEARYEAPILHPPKIIALGRNYVLHAKEAKLPIPKEPIIFEKASSSVTGPYDTIEITREYGRIDHEAELAVVIGKTARRVSKKDAFKFVAGYTVLQDITARDLQNADLAANNPWFRSKSFDSFTPMGPYLVLADEIKLPVHLGIECRVNGRVRQKANTKDMIFDIPTTIEFITRHITLEPGDVISTGTPEGIGEITDGDEIVTRIEKIGEMRNRVRFESR